VAERHALLDAIFVSGMDRGGASEGTAALGIFALQQMTLAGARAQDFSAGGNLEPLGRRLLGFNAFGTSHKSNELLSKRTRNIRTEGQRRKGNQRKIEKNPKFGARWKL